MLQIVFLIVKIILLILAALLGMMFLLLLLVLFVPVRYRAYGIKNHLECRAEGQLSWFLHLLHVPVSWQNGELCASVKILGFTIMRFPEEEVCEKARRKNRSKIKKKTQPAPAQEIKEEPAPDKPESYVKTEDLRDRRAEKKSVFRFFQGIPGKFKNLKCTIIRFCGKIKRMVREYRKMKAFVLDERMKAAIALIWKQAGILLRQALPRRVRGELHFGTEDPALTGEILGGISIFYPLFMDNVKVTPDFENSVLEGELFLKGRLRPVTVLRIGWRLYRDKNVRWMYRRLNR